MRRSVSLQPVCLVIYRCEQWHDDQLSLNSSWILATSIQVAYYSLAVSGADIEVLTTRLVFSRYICIETKASYTETIANFIIQNPSLSEPIY